MPKPTHKEVLPRQTSGGPDHRAGLQAGEEATAKLAYKLWLERGQPEGSPDEDWYRAQELLRGGEAAAASSSG